MVAKFQIIAKDWYKRRRPDEGKVVPISVEIPDYQPIANHMCKMHVTFSDGTTKQLISRVIFNKLTQQWTVDGMEVAVKVIPNT